MAVASSIACAITAAADISIPEPDPAASLRDRYATLSRQVEQNALPPGLYLESVEGVRAARGDVYALVGYSFGSVADALMSPANWCAALILHINIKYCRASLRGQRTALTVAIGRKIDQPLSDTFRTEFDYSVTSAGADYMKVGLDARKGPLGTGNYRITLESTGLDGERTLLHIRYSYTYGVMARFAMRFYLATSGRGKVGFTVIGSGNGAPPRFIGGARGALERNVMRYFLAIDAYLGALTAPAPQRFEASLERWFAATERYALQLHEIDHDTYVAMKRREYRRQQTQP